MGGPRADSGFAHCYPLLLARRPFSVFGEGPRTGEAGLQGRARGAPHSLWFPYIVPVTWAGGLQDGIHRPAKDRGGAQTEVGAVHAKRLSRTKELHRESARSEMSTDSRESAWVSDVKSETSPVHGILSSVGLPSLPSWGSPILSSARRTLAHPWPWSG